MIIKYIGKTIQTIAIIASDIEYRKRQYKETKNPEFVHLPLFVVCPPTLIRHWHYEVKRFCPHLSTLQYYGNISTRKLHQSQYSQCDIVIMSYETLRNDIQDLNGSQMTWNY